MYRMYLKKLVLTLFLLGISCQNAAAIGAWVSGKVTQVPWREKEYLHIGINHVKYTIMPKAKVEANYKVDRVIHKKTLDVLTLRLQNSVNALVEGNRIYQIETIP